ncbi:hypothetical protein [Symbiobacterium terraclitae]|uniref:hypothetical protein n=1 Tax=Symbiobacterium terraclitae TaxID=557451 RepID=UPI0035B503E0
MESLMIPLFVLGVIAIVAFWNGPAGRRPRGQAGTAVGNALETLNAALGGGEHKAALEYRKQVHDEEDQAGGPGPDDPSRE